MTLTQAGTIKEHSTVVPFMELGDQANNADADHGMQECLRGEKRIIRQPQKVANGMAHLDCRRGIEESRIEDETVIDCLLR